MFGPCREVGPILEVFQLHNDYEQFAWHFLPVCGPIGTIFFVVARTYQSYRVSLILAYSDARGALLVCTLLP